MAARLTVIISQSAGVAGASSIEEALVAELLMQPGLDAILVGPLETIQPDSTDCLCISGYNHNLVFVGWQSASEVATEFRRLGMERNVEEFGGEQATARVVTPRASSTVYLIRLDRQSQLADITRQLNAMLKARAVKTVGISMSGIEPQRMAAPLRVDKVEPRSEKEKGAGGSAGAGQVENASGVGAELSEEQCSDLDQLLDDFEALDF